MKALLKKIYTILVLITNFVIRRKHYRLTFVKEDGFLSVPAWFYDFKWWGFSHDNLLMVAGADTLCEMYSDGNGKAVVDIIASKKPLKPEEKEGLDEYVGESFIQVKRRIDKFLWGRTYTKSWLDSDGKKHLTTFWICPVTLFVLGRYPNYIYLKKLEEK